MTTPVVMASSDGTSGQPWHLWNSTMMSYTESSPSRPGVVHDSYLAEFSVQTLMYILIGLVGVISNGLVAVVILKSRLLRRRLMNQFLLNQSFLDMYVSLLLIAHSATKIEKSQLSGFTGALYCKVWSTKAFMWAAFISSTYNLVAVTLERYMEVVHPIRHKASFTSSKAHMLMALSWFIGPCYTMAHVIPPSVVRDGHCLILSDWPNLGVQQFVAILSFLVQFLIPLLIMIYCYTHMALTLRVKVMPYGGSAIITEGEKKRQERNRRARRNVIRTLAMCGLLFVCCWCWNQVLFLAWGLGVKPSYSSPFYHMTVYLVFLNCCVNPFVYSVKYEQFQKAAKGLFWQTPSNSNNANISTITNYYS